MKPWGKATGEAAIRDRRRIFLVDDHAVVRQGVGYLLNLQPDLTVCGEAGTAREAFGSIVNLQPDAVVVDLTLREGNGLDLIKDIHAVLPKVAILVLTMHEEKQFAERSLRAGALGFIVKAEAIEKVVEALRIVLAGKLYINDGLAAHLVAQRYKPGRNGSVDPVSRLSDRELQVYQLLGQWKGTREIAGELNLSIKTVEYYRQTIRQKLNLRNGTELVQEATTWVNHSSGPAGGGGAGEGI
jgi:DNA-binding NarL/FixJ family response regulator